MFIRIKKLDPSAVIPSYAKPGDAGMDLTAITKSENPEGRYTEYGTGLALEIPEGHAGFIFPRSSASNTDQIQSNCVGVVDAGYRGEVKVRLRSVGDAALSTHLGAEPVTYQVGDRVAQLIVMPVPQVIFEEVAELGTSDRGDGGFGSTGI